MNDHARPSADSSLQAELSGVLLESVEEILREPIEERDLTRALDRALHLDRPATRERSRPRYRLSHSHTLERIQSMIRTHKRLAVAAVAVMTAAAAGLVVYVALFSSPGGAYALEQTAQANEHIMSYHIRITPPPRDNISEAWVQFNADGAPIRARGDWLNSGEGPYVVIMSGEKCDVWFKAKNSHVVMPANDFLKQFAAQRERFDPKLAFEKLRADEKAGKVQVATQEPSQEGQPITLTVTSKGSPDWREAYEVNSKTKLLEQMIGYRRRGGKWERQWRREYLSYNKELDPNAFEIDLPKDILTADQLNQEVGLAKGDLSEKEIAVKVVREFFTAMIARDYAKASKMYSGIPVDKLAKEKDWFRYTRIASIGEPTQAIKFGPIRVPVKVEWEIAKPNPLCTCSTSPTVRITEAEKATKAVREFYEALIVQDYEKATRIFREAGMVDEHFLPDNDIKNMKKAFEGNFAKVTRIVEIGKPVSHRESHSTEVPIKVELKISRKVGKEVKEFSPLVNPVMGQPGRWGICGGI
jgi:hypothetical protein